MSASHPCQKRLPWRQVRKRYVQIVFSVATVLEKGTVPVCRQRKGFPGSTHQLEDRKALVDRIGIATSDALEEQSEMELVKANSWWENLQQTAEKWVLPGR